MPLVTGILIASASTLALTTATVGSVFLAKRVKDKRLLTLVNLTEKDCLWIKEKKYMVDMRDVSELNERTTVRRGKEIVSKTEVKEVAIKVIEKNRQAETELGVLKGLKHENIVKYIDFDEIATNGVTPCLYIVMELCDCNLTTFMEDRKDEVLTFKDFKSIGYQLLSGLHYIHEHGLIHRDIKPDNILVIKNETIGTFKYSDFGITKRMIPAKSYVTETRAGVGSEGYCAPESYAADAKLTQAVDVFSLGIVLAQLTSNGEHPYGANECHWLYNICENNLDLKNVDIPTTDGERQELIKLLTRMLSANPCDRPPVVDIKEHEFFCDEGQKCILCFTNKPDIAFVPCGHMHVCPVCAEQLDTCPTCRQQIERRMPVYQL